jgi:GNAT superfamily N-acetyltransferase
MSDLRFVYAQRCDVKDVLYFIKELARYQKLEHEVLATEELLMTNIFEENNNIKVIFAEVDGKRIGFALYFYTFATFLGRCGIYIEDLYIMPEYRSQGIGKKLFSHIAQIATEQSYGRIELTCLDWNVQSIEFYKSIGMKPVDGWTVFRMDSDNIKELANYVHN